MNDSEAILERVLRDLNRELGTDLPYIDSFDTKNADIANVVLPLLANIADRINHSELRHSVYRRFHTPLAYPYFDEILRWFEKEIEYDLQATLTSVVAFLVRPRDAERVWRLCNRYRPFHYMLLAKLAKFKSIGTEVANTVLQDLMAGSVPEWELEYAYKIRDPRIEEWFDKLLREKQEKLRQPEQKQQMSRSSRLPVVLSRLAPDYRKELTSAELNVEDASEFLSGTVKQFGVVLPETFAELKFLDSLKLDRWYTASAKSTSGADVTIWFRLEDVDVVEIVITTDDLHVRDRDAVPS